MAVERLVTPRRADHADVRLGVAGPDVERRVGVGHKQES